MSTLHHDTFRQAVRQFVQGAVAPHVDSWERAGVYPLGLHRQAASQRLLSFGHAPDDQADDPVAHAILVDELTRAGSQALSMGLASHGVSLLALRLGHPALSREIEPAVLRGERTLVLAITEPQAGSDLRGLRCTARQVEGEHHRLSGDKAFVCNGARADWIVVAARSGGVEGQAEGEGEGRLGLYLADGRSPALSASPVSCLGWRALPLSHLHFDGVPARRIDLQADAGALLQQALGRERLNLAVMAQASSRLALDLTVAHVRQRRAGRGTLFDQTSLRAALAAHRADWEVAQLYVQQCVAWCASGALTAVRSAIAKNTATALLERIARDAVQFHGAHGCIEPSVVERIYRDAKLLTIGGGAHEVLLGVIARSLTEET